MQVRILLGAKKPLSADGILSRGIDVVVRVRYGGTTQGGLMADQGSSARRWSLDMPISITVEVGRARTTLGDLLALGPGAVLELNKPSHEPLDIFAGGALIARGETVVVGDHFGVRITEVVPAAPIAAADSNTETPA